jgi:hypothetical protein
MILWHLHKGNCKKFTDIFRRSSSRNLNSRSPENKTEIILNNIYKSTDGWRKLDNEELHNLYCPPSIIRIIKSRRMRWAGHVA